MSEDVHNNNGPDQGPMVEVREKLEELRRLRRDLNELCEQYREVLSKMQQVRVDVVGCFQTFYAFEHLVDALLAGAARAQEKAKQLISELDESQSHGKS